MAQPGTITVLDPQGTPREIPAEQQAAAIQAGGKLASKMVDPQGTPRWIPNEMVDQATKAGGKPFTEEQPSLPTKAWRWANTPLLSPYEGETMARDAANAPPTLADANHPIWSGIKRGIEGAYADTISTGRSLVSAPASLALLGAGALGRAPGAIGAIAKTVQGLGAAGYAAKGASDIADVATQPGNMSPDDIQKLFFGGAQVAGGAAGVGDAIAGSSAALGSRMMNRVMKPGVKNFERGQNPGQAVIDEGLTANSTQDLADKIQERKGDLGQQIRNIRTSPAGQAVSVDATKAILDPLNDAMQQAQKDGRADLYQKLQSVQDQLTQQWAPDANGTLQPTGPRKLSGLNAQELYDIKHQVDNVTKWTGSGFDSELNQVKVAVRSNLRDLENQELPEVAPYRMRYGGMKNAGDAAQHRADMVQKNDAIGLPDYLIAGQQAAEGGMRAITSGNPMDLVKGAAAGVALAGMRKALVSPAVQTRAAQFLAHEGPAAAVAAAPLAAAQPEWRRKKR